MEKVRIALLGVADESAIAWGRWAVTSKDTEVTALWDPDVERGQRVAGLLNIRFQPDLEKVLTERHPIAAFIGVETSRRPDVIAKASAAGKRIMCAAPQAVSLEQLDRVLGALPKNGPGGMVCFPMRFDPMCQRVRAMVIGGKVAKVDIVRLRLGNNRAVTPGFARSWLANPELSGGGVLMEQGIHAADFLLWLLGTPLDVVAQVGFSQTAPPVEDNAIVVYRFARNVIVEVTCSWVCHAAMSTLEVYGEAGTLIAQGTDAASREFVHDTFPRIYCTDFQERHWQPVETASTFWTEQYEIYPVEAFVEAVRSGSPLPVTMVEGRNALAMIRAAYESAQQGRRMVFTSGDRGLGFRPE